jgi:hypothetical protein
MSDMNKAYVNDKGALFSCKGRILWNSVFEKRKGKNGKEGKFEINLLIPKGSNIDALKTAVMEAGKDKFSKAFKDAGGKFPSSIRSPFRKTAENDKIGEFADEFPIYFAARSMDPPGIVGPNGKSAGVTPEDVYAGRWARISCDAYGYEVDGNKGVSFGLQNIQLLDHDDPMEIGGSRVPAESQFDAVEGVSGNDDASSDNVFG